MYNQQYSTNYILITKFRRLETLSPLKWFLICNFFGTRWLYENHLETTTTNKTIFIIFATQVVDYKVEFSKWWVAEFKTIKYPSQGTVFDYYIDTETKEFLPWTHVIPKFELDSDMPLQV